MINEAKFNQIVEAAKIKAANDPKCLRAIKSARRSPVVQPHSRRKHESRVGIDSSATIVARLLL